MKIHNVLMWQLTALVESVEPEFVILTHLFGITKGHVRVRDWDHCGLVVLGEGISTPGYKPVRLNYITFCKHNVCDSKE